MNCFYCNGQMKRSGKWCETVDHVYPQWMIAAWPNMGSDWRRMNKVKACRRCNAQKGSMHPIDWLAVMPGGHGEANRFAALLAQLGTAADVIAVALSRRA